MFGRKDKEAIISSDHKLGIVVDAKKIIKNLSSAETEKLLKQIEDFDELRLNKECWLYFLNADEKKVLWLLNNKNVVKGYVIYFKDKERDSVELEKISTDTTDKVRGRGTFLMYSLFKLLDNTGTKELKWHAVNSSGNYGPSSFYHKALKKLGRRYTVDICGRTEQRIFVSYLDKNST